MPQVIYQQGLDGYSSTLDTMLAEYEPDTSYASAASLTVDGNDRGRGTDQVLLRFDDIIGSGTSQIPLGAHITSATLILQTTNTGSGAELHRMLTSWNEDSTWESLGSGLQTDGTEAVAAADLLTGRVRSLGPSTFDVTASMQAWADGANNYGWAFLPKRHDGWDFDSSEGTTAPKLIVEYTLDTTNPPPSNAAPVVTAGGTLSYTENAPASAIAPTLAISDADSASLVGATVEISAGYVSGQDDLIFGAQNGISGAWDAASGALMLTGTATVAQYEAALASVQYVNTSDNPSGAARTIEFQVNDGESANSLSSPVTSTVQVTPVNDTPVAGSDAYSTGQDTSLTIAATGVLANDTDVDSSGLTAVLASGPAHGSLTLNPDGSFTYTPESGYSGSDSFSYKANDGSLDSNDAMVNLTITATPPGNTAPDAVDDSASTKQDTAVRVAVLTNDTDPNNDTLTVTGAADPTHGSATVNSDGTITYTPAASYLGDDSFTYSISDGHGGTDTATVNLTVTSSTPPPPDNTAPVAADDSYTTTADQTLTVTTAQGVLANDTDANGDVLTAALAAGPTHGTLTLNANGSFSYTPVAGYSGSDSFTYKANDGSTDSNVASVHLTVAPGTPPQTEAHTYDHVFVVFMENHSASEIYGNPDASFINNVLRASGETFTNMHAIARPSQPNYLAFYSGSTQGVTDNNPHSFGSTPTLGDQFAAAGLSLVWEAEAGTRPNHLPTTSFDDSAYNRTFASDWPAMLSNLANAPDLVAVSPDQIHSMHDGTVADGDAWLRANFSSVLDFVKNPANNSLFVLTFDEPNTSAPLTTPIPTVAVGAGIAAGISDSTNVNLYSLLQEFEQQHNFTRLGSAATAPDLILG